MKQSHLEELVEQALKEEIGQQVRLMRLIKKKSRRQVSEHIKKSPQQIEHYENGVHRISVVVLYQIAKFLDVDIVEMLPESIRKSVNKKGKRNG